MVRQIDTPERILALPVDSFVDDFIGSGSTLKGLHFERVSGLSLQPYPTMTVRDSVEVGQSALSTSGREWLLLLDEDRRPSRWLRKTDLRPGGDLISRGQKVRSRVEQNATLHDTLEGMLKSSTGTACVVDPRGRFQGVVEIGHLTEVIHRLRVEAQEHYQALGASSGTRTAPKTHRNGEPQRTRTSPISPLLHSLGAPPEGGRWASCWPRSGSSLSQPVRD
ncbi:MAG TPA: hypothetical protein VES02_18675 [Dermatophilaceae bacterium]|nr:hypothetical protein [Dermatophilaceae bacterium]